MTCSEKYQVANSQLSAFPLSSLYFTSTVSNETLTSHVTGQLDFATPYPQYFYVAISNCLPTCTISHCQGPVILSYALSFTNGVDSFTQQFSYDEAGVLEMNILFSIFQAGTALLSLQIVKALKQKQKCHHTYKILVGSVFLYFLSLIVKILHYGQYASDGVGLRGYLILGQLFYAASEISLVLLLILLGKGWTIVRRKITASGRVKIAIYISCYGCFYVAAIVYAALDNNAAVVSYFYASPPGFLVIVLRIVGYVWFSYSVFTTIKNYDSKKHFYGKFYVLYSAWLLSLPLFASIALLLPDWTRAKVIEGVSLSLHFLALLILVLMYNPDTRFNKSFPFHSKTKDMEDIFTSSAVTVKSNQKNTIELVSPRVSPTPDAASMEEGHGVVYLRALASKLRERLRAAEACIYEISAIVGEGINIDDEIVDDEDGDDLPEERKKPTTMSFGNTDVDIIKNNRYDYNASNRVAGGGKGMTSFENMDSRKKSDNSVVLETITSDSSPTSNHRNAPIPMKQSGWFEQL